MLLRQPQGWYPPVVVGTGCAGIALTVAALAAVDARRLRWVLLSAATAALVAVIGVTVAAG